MVNLNEYATKKLETQLLAESRAKLKEFATDMLKADEADQYIGFDIPKDGLGKTEIPTESLPIDSKKQSIADTIRQAKLGKGKAFDALLGIPVAIWDGAVELVATSIEGAEGVANAIEKGVKYVQNTDWYRNLSTADKVKVNKEFVDQINSIIAVFQKKYKKKKAHLQQLFLFYTMAN